MSGLDSLTIERTSTADQISDALHAMIVAGELEPGSPLNESVLARQLAVSRNTVREAVRILGQSGLIQQEMHRGAIVRPVQLDEVRDLYRVRSILEQSAVGGVHELDLAPLELALGNLIDAAHATDEAAMVARDLAFHAAIVGILGSPRLDRYFAEICVELRFYLAVISRVDREVETPDALIEQHAVMLRALHDGDRLQAAALIKAHIESNAERVCAVFSERLT